MADVSQYQQQISVCKDNKRALEKLKNYINAQADFYEDNHRNIKNIKSTDSDFKGKKADKTADYIEDLQLASDKYLKGIDDMKEEIARLINAQKQSINGYKSIIKAEENKELYKRP